MSSFQNIQNLIQKHLNHFEERPRYEFGDDIFYVSYIKTDIAAIDEELKNIVWPLVDKENTQKLKGLFYSLIYEIDELNKLIAKVSDSNSGSSANTTNTLEQLRICQTVFENFTRQFVPYEEEKIAFKNLQIIIEQLKNSSSPYQRLQRLAHKLRELLLEEPTPNIDQVRDVIQEIDSYIKKKFNCSFVQLAQRKGRELTLPLFISPPEPRIPLDNCWAVIVGVQNHQHGYFDELPHALNDAYHLASMLVGARGFSTKRTALLIESYGEHPPIPDLLPINPTNSEIFSKLENFSRKAEENDFLIFYFSGHAIYRDKVPYIVCQNTQNSFTSRAMDTSAIRMKSILDQIKESKARVKVLILDTCHAGAMLDSGIKKDRGMPEGFIKHVFAELTDGMAIITSCEKNQFSYPYQRLKSKSDLRAPHSLSLFTHFLIELLREYGIKEKNYITVDTLINYVSEKMNDETFDRSIEQTPKCQIESDGPLMFVDWR